MKTIDLSPLKNNDAEFQKVTEIISERFKCDWDDSIHDSYGRYVGHMQEHARKVKTIRCKAESLVTEAEALGIDNLIGRATALCREADAI